jgi:hypothetical protein
MITTTLDESLPTPSANIATAKETLAAKYDGLSRGDGSIDRRKDYSLKAYRPDYKSILLSESELPVLRQAVALLIFAGLGLVLFVILRWPIHRGQSRSTKMSEYTSDIRRNESRVTRAIGQFLRTRISRAIFLFRVSCIPLILVCYYLHLTLQSMFQNLMLGRWPFSNPT